MNPCEVQDKSQVEEYSTCFACLHLIACKLWQSIKPSLVFPLRKRHHANTEDLHQTACAGKPRLDEGFFFSLRVIFCLKSMQNRSEALWVQRLHIIITFFLRVYLATCKIDFACINKSSTLIMLLRLLLQQVLTTIWNLLARWVLGLMYPTASFYFCFRSFPVYSMAERSLQRFLCVVGGKKLLELIFFLVGHTYDFED